MTLFCDPLIESASGTITVRIKADSREEALENGQELFPGCRLALVNPEQGEQNACCCVAAVGVAMSMFQTCLGLENQRLSPEMITTRVEIPSRME